MENIESTALTEEHCKESADMTTTLEALRQENEELRKQLENVVATASANEKIWRHFAEIERILFRTRQLDQLVEELLQEIKARFEPDQLILLLSHSDILERFFPDLSRQNEPLAENTWILPLPVEMGSTLYGDSQKPFLLSPASLRDLLRYLPAEAVTIQSGVLIPLSVHQMMFGSLILGSTDAGRYQPNDGTDLLEQLGIKIALCMDNCLTYEKVKDFAVMDPLTGLHNFFQVRTILDKEFRKARRLQKPLSILMIDLNFFHEIEGHFDMGSGVLKHVAGLLREILPENESLLGRYGSDEFLVLLPDIPEEEAREVVPYLSQSIRKSPFIHQNTAVLVQATIGVGSLNETVRRSQDLLDAADMELCRLKMTCSGPGS